MELIDRISFILNEKDEDKFEELKPEPKGDPDEQELKMGIEIEKEHTNDEEIAERIARHHLSEIPDYYTRLKKMEKDAGVED